MDMCAHVDKGPNPKTRVKTRNERQHPWFRLYVPCAQRKALYPFFLKLFWSEHRHNRMIIKMRDGKCLAHDDPQPTWARRAAWWGAIPAYPLPVAQVAYGRPRRIDVEDSPKEGTADAWERSECHTYTLGRMEPSLQTMTRNLGGWEATIGGCSGRRHRLRRVHKGKYQNACRSLCWKRKCRGGHECCAAVRCRRSSEDVCNHFPDDDRVVCV